MSLVRLVYASRATDKFQPASIKTILASARRNNGSSGVTGLLCFNQRCFLQCLEGPRDVVSQTYERILHDDRHQNAEIISFHYISRREFENWNMGYLQNTETMRDIIKRRTGQDEFTPLTLLPDDALALLTDIRDLIADLMEES